MAGRPGRNTAWNRLTLEEHALRGTKPDLRHRTPESAAPELPPIDPKLPQATRALQFINSLTHTKGPFARQRFNLRPWQVRIVRQLFKTGKDGVRQYRTALLMLPRKNGKSELAAALAVYFLLRDGELGGEVYSAAADRDQAALVFNVAAQMIRDGSGAAGRVRDCRIAEAHRPSREREFLSRHQRRGVLQARVQRAAW